MPLSSEKRKPRKTIKKVRKRPKPKGIKKSSTIDMITVDLKPLQPFGDFSLLGWKPGWLATYIIFSLAASILVRKWLKVY